MKKLFCFFWLFLMGIQAVVYAQDDPAFEWAFNTTGTPISGGESNGKEIVVDGFGKVFVLGYFERTADFDFSGNTYNLTSGSGSLFLAKYESNGDLIWAKKMAGTSSSINSSPDVDQSFNLALDSHGDVILSGTFYGTVDFDPGPANVTVSPNGLSDMFISKFDSNGNFVWVKIMGGAGNSYMRVQTLFLDDNNNIFIGGVFDTQADFNPGPALNVLNAVEGLDGFFAKYDSNGNYVWAKSIAGNQGNEYVNSIAVDSVGNVLIVGNFVWSCDFNPDAGTNLLNSIEGSADAFIAKYSSSGTYLWAKQIGGNENDDINVMKLDTVGNIYITGVFSGTVDFDPNAGTVTHTSLGAGDTFIAKYNFSGSYLWSKPIGGAGYEEAFSLLLDNNNAIYITGWFFGTSDFDPGAGTASLTSIGYNDVFWAKYDSNGNYIWSKSVGGLNPEPTQHTQGVLEKGFSLASGTNGQVFLTGLFYGTADFDPGSGTVNVTSPIGYSNAFWMRFDTSGNYLNVVAIGGYDGAGSSQVGVCVEQGNSGDVYSAGYFRDLGDFDLGPNQSLLNSPYSENTFIAKYNDDCGYIWAKSLGGQGQALIYTMVLDQDENIYVSGSLGGEIDFDPGNGIALLNGSSEDIASKVFLAKYDSDGKYLWAKAIGSSGSFQSMARDSNGNILISGHFTGTADFDPGEGIASLTSEGYDDMFIAKYDINGNYVWAKRIDSSNQTIPNSMVCDNAGNFYIAGLFTGITDFDPGIQTANYNTENQSYNVFVVKYSPNGNLVWVEVPQGEGFDEAKTITIDPTGNLIVAGKFGYGSIDLNPGGSNGNVIGQGNENLFFTKYGSNGNFIWAKVVSGEGDYAEASAVKTDALGNIYLTGSFLDFTGAIDFNPDAINQNVLISSTNTRDVFFAKYDRNGNYLWAKSMAGDGNDYGLSLSVKNNKLLLTGYFSGEADFDASSGSHVLTCVNNGNMFLAKYSVCGNLDNTVTVTSNTLTANAVAGTYQWIDCNNGGAFLNGQTNQSFTPLISGNYAVIITSNNCQVVSSCHAVLGVDSPDSLINAMLYPNPTNGDFVIELPRMFSEITMKITNVLGETISVNRFSEAEKLSLSLLRFPQGLYFVTVDCDGLKQDFKVIKK